MVGCYSRVWHSTASNKVQVSMIQHHLWGSTQRKRALVTLDSLREVCGRGRLEVVARKLLLLLDTDPRRDPGADGARSLPGPCGVRGIMAACGHRLGRETGVWVGLLKRC